MPIEKGSMTRGAHALTRLNTKGFNISTAANKDPSKTLLLFLSKPHPKSMKVCNNPTIWNLNHQFILARNIFCFLLS